MGLFALGHFLVTNLTEGTIRVIQEPERGTIRDTWAHGRCTILNGFSISGFGLGTSAGVAPPTEEANGTPAFTSGTGANIIWRAKVIINRR